MCSNSRNIYELPGLAGESTLFGSERMTDADGNEILNRMISGVRYNWELGDWDWDVFFLMQDAAPCDEISERIGTHPYPFSARNFIDEPRGGGAATNRNLHKLAQRIPCRKLAGSALIGLLKPGKDYSGKFRPLLGCPWIRDYCKTALEWVLSENDNRRPKAVFCLGGPALDLIAEILSIDDATKMMLTRDRGSVTNIRNFTVSHLWHPSRWPPGGRRHAYECWKRAVLGSGLPWRDEISPGR